MNNWNIRFWEYEFMSPGWLWLLLLVPFLLIYLYRKERVRTGDVKFTQDPSSQRSLGNGWIKRIREGLILCTCLIVTLMILALAKPFHWSLYDDSDANYKNGIDIILTLDVSGSMLARDFEPNRLEASKVVAKEFVDGRKGDRIGLVIYGESAFTACPATLDYNVLKEQITATNVDDRLGGGTAIGTGLGTAVTRLRKDTGAGKVIILLTDGRNNAGDISPVMAAELARAKQVRVYTIGIGGTGAALTPTNTVFGTQFVPMEVDIDEESLKKIAKITDGKYFRAKDKEGLKKIYEEIEKLEKRKMEDERFKSEPPAFPQAFLNFTIILGIVVIGSYTVLFKTHE